VRGQRAEPEAERFLCQSANQLRFALHAPQPASPPRPTKHADCMCTEEAIKRAGCIHCDTTPHNPLLSTHDSSLAAWQSALLPLGAVALARRKESTRTVGDRRGRLLSLCAALTCSTDLQHRSAALERVQHRSAALKCMAPHVVASHTHGETLAQPASRRCLSP